ncbi:NucA/NucB deoxyribonuclease domain-containing protein [Streptomyces sp. NPDC003442]
MAPDIGGRPDGGAFMPTAVNTSGAGTSAADGRKRAIAAGVKGDFDAATAAEEGAGVLAGRPAPRKPKDAFVKNCDKRYGPSTPHGYIEARFAWCTKWIAWKVTRDGRGRVIAYHAVYYYQIGYGRDDGQRSVRIYLKPSKVIARGRAASLSTPFGFVPVCKQASSTPGCAVDKPMVTKSLAQWKAQDLAGKWTTWTISSDENQSSATDKVSFHRFSFQFSTGVATTPQSDDYMLRCDSAQIGARTKACVFHDIVPNLKYALYKPNGSRTAVHEVARHVKDAFQHPDAANMYPKESHPKKIPGRYTGSVDPDTPDWLERVPYNGTDYKANSNTKNHACHRTGPYRLTGLPSPPGNGQQCDEYPFASTKQGAANPTWDFSVRAVPKDDNHAAGQALKKFYRQWRILYFDNDFFYVDVVGSRRCRR